MLCSVMIANIFLGREIRSYHYRVSERGEVYYTVVNSTWPCINSDEVDSVFVFRKQFISYSSLRCLLFRSIYNLLIWLFIWAVSSSFFSMSKIKASHKRYVLIYERKCLFKCVIGQYLTWICMSTIQH